MNAPYPAFHINIAYPFQMPVERVGTNFAKREKVSAVVPSVGTKALKQRRQSEGDTQ